MTPLMKSGARYIRLECLKLAVSTYAGVKDGMSSKTRHVAIVEAAKHYVEWVDGKGEIDADED